MEKDEMVQLVLTQLRLEIIELLTVKRDAVAPATSPPSTPIFELSYIGRLYAWCVNVIKELLGFVPGEKAAASIKRKNVKREKRKCQM